MNWTVVSIWVLCIVVIRACIYSQCDGIPNCWEHGTCDNTTGTPACVCDPGFSGLECQTSDCGCVHGTCTAGVCVCDPSWGGPQCDVFQGIWPLYEPICTINGSCVCGGAGVPCAITPQVGVDLAIFTRSKIDVYTTEERILSWPQIRYTDYPDCDCRIGSSFIPTASKRKILTVQIDATNIGTAHLFIGAPSATLYTKDCMGRSLIDNWARLQLFNSTMHVVRDVYTKHRYWDSTGGIFNQQLFTDSFQGLSRRSICSSYVNGNECSWLDVTDLPNDDTYTVRITINPDNAITELDYTNNALNVPLECAIDCGVHGHCEWGSCMCDVGWVGPDCASIPDDEDSTGCIPVCNERNCGDDGCGGLCGVCDIGECTIDGACLSNPYCYSDECGGSNAYGVVCGYCDKPRTECMTILGPNPIYAKCAPMLQ